MRWLTINEGRCGWWTISIWIGVMSAGAWGMNYFDDEGNLVNACAECPVCRVSEDED